MTIAIVGAGTIIYQDEGIGVYAQKYLEENYEFDHDITFVDGGVLGFKLMVYYQDYDKVVILDTITMQDDEAGAIYNLPAQELMGLGSYKQSAHEVEIVEMLEICSLLERMADVNIIGIVPENIDEVITKLTPKLNDKFPDFIKVALTQIETYGITYKKKASYTSLDEIIHAYDNPVARKDLEGLK